MAQQTPVQTPIQHTITTNVPSSSSNKPDEELITSMKITAPTITQDEVDALTLRLSVLASEKATLSLQLDTAHATLRETIITTCPPVIEVIRKH